MELGKRIAEIRKDRDLTQEELAELCSVTRQTISNWENGKSYPDLETLVLISDTFDVSLDAILKGDRKMVSKISKDQQHGKNFALKLIAAIVLTVAVVLGGYSYAYLYETYIPYEETGVTVSGSGTIHTDRNYSCFYGSSYVTETVGDEMHYVEFLYLTSSIHSRYLEKKPKEPLTIATYVGPFGESENDGKVFDDIITEVYYLPEKYAASHGLLKGKHAQQIPLDASEAERQEMIRQIKAESILLWERK